MSVIKNEFPILEFDSDDSAIIMPRHENLDLQLPKKAVYVFVEGYVDKYAEKNNCRKAGEFLSATKRFPVYITKHKGEEVCLCQAPVGAAAAAQFMDWLIGYGVSQIVSAGSCGVLESFDEGEFLIPVKALRDEGTSYHYLPPSRFVDVSETALTAIEKTMERHNLPYTSVVTWTTDGFYRETKGMVEYRKNEGCRVVEMECAALAACAQRRGAVWGEILYTADTLADVENYDERNWGGNAYEYALTLCLDAVLNIPD